MLRRALWIPSTVLFLSLIHLAVLSVASRNPAQIWGAVLLSLFLVLWLNRRRISNCGRYIPALTTAVLVIATVADFLINFVPFEPRPNIGSAYRIFLSALLFLLPVTAILLFRVRRYRPVIPVAGLAMLLLPPFSYELNLAFQAPLYGRITGLLYLLLLWRKLKFSGRDAILFLPAAAGIPALFYGHSPGNTLDHIQVWSLFAVTSVYIRHLREKRLTLLTLLFSFSLMHALFVFFYPQLRAVNSNVTAMYTEMMMLFGLIAIIDSRIKAPYKIGSSLALAAFLLVLNLRMESQTGTIVVLFAVTVFFVHRLFQSRASLKKWSSLVFTGAILAVILAAAYIVFLDHSRTIVSRRFVWEAALAGFGHSPLSMILGTGDFGPFHLYLFRHLQRPITDADLTILKGEPYLISQHAHNDVVFMLYAGGLVYLVIFLFLIVGMIRSSGSRGPSLEAGARASVAALLLHGLTEPISTGVTTGFLFFLSLAFFTQPPRATRMRRYGNAIIAVATLYFIVLAFLQIPVTRFWKQNNALFFAIRKETQAAPVNPAELQFIESRLQTLITLAPYESDYYRQAGDAVVLQSGIPYDVADPAAELYYCKAFAIRSSPLHYASIRRMQPDLTRACGKMQLRQKLEGYDPQELLLRDIKGVPLF